MKRAMVLLILSVLIAVSSFLGGCAGCEQDWSHVKSYTAGLTREVTLFDCSGNTIRIWRVDGTVEDQGGSFRFMCNGKAITIAGTIIIEEVEK
jgi:hypothetical protein